MKRHGSSTTIFADLMTIVTSFLMLVLMPLMHRVDEAGKTITELEVVASGHEDEMEQLGAALAGKDKEIDEKDRTIAGQRSEIDRQKGAHQITQQDIQGLKDQMRRGIPIDVVFVQDTSMSQGDEIERDMKNIALTAALFPRVTTIRAGIVAFQSPQTSKSYKTFPLQELKSPTQDQGDSLQSTKKFLSQLQLKGGLVDVRKAARKGIDMLSKHKQPGRRQVLVLISDVAPGDITGVEWWQVALMKDDIQQWINEPKTDRRFLALFSHQRGDELNVGYRPKEHRKAFRMLADFPGGQFEDSPGAIFPTLFETLFAPSRK